MSEISLFKINEIVDKHIGNKEKILIKIFSEISEDVLKEIIKVSSSNTIELAQCGGLRYNLLFPEKSI